LAVIAHHIEPWSRTHDHWVANLAVLCLEHHARAHSTGSLEQSLTTEKVRDAKARREAEVSRLDAKSILESSRLENSHWLWFNHVRLFDAARRASVDITRLPAFSFACRQGLISSNGEITKKQNGEAYLYAGGETAHFFSFLSKYLEQLSLERRSLTSVTISIPD
jgi:hypothetical protein